jgi:hypothetical protein
VFACSVESSSSAQREKVLAVLAQVQSVFRNLKQTELALALLYSRRSKEVEGVGMENKRRG